MDGAGGDNGTDDFDLFWGMGPSRDEQRNESTQVKSPHALTPSLMRGLWSLGSAGTLESYGHKHHVHAPGDIARDVHPNNSAPRRPSWSTAGSPLQSTSQPQRRESNPSVAPAAQLQASGKVETKLEELAAAITSTVMSKLDSRVKGVLPGEAATADESNRACGCICRRKVPYPVGQTRHEDDSGVVARYVAAEVGPFRSRLDAMEHQIAWLKAELDRKVSLADRPPKRMQTSSASYRSSDVSPGHSDGLPACTHGNHHSSRGRKSCRGGGSNSSRSDGASLEQSLIALTQRTGTLEGRCKQVQAKVAILDNAFGSKTSDWARTIRDMLSQHKRPRTRQSNPTCSLHIDTGNNKAGGGANESHSQKIDNAENLCGAVARQDVSQTASDAGTAEGMDSKIDCGIMQTTSDLSSVSDNGPITGDRHDRGQHSDQGVPSDDAVTLEEKPAAASNSSTQTAPTTARQRLMASDLGKGCEDDDVGQSTLREAAAWSAIPSALPAAPRTPRTCQMCTATDERCRRLEIRVTESQSTLDSLREEVVLARKEVETSKATTLSTIRAEIDVVEKSRSSAGSAKWAPKGAVERLTSDVRHVEDRAKEGEDALAMLDHGLTGLREEVAPLLSSLSSLKKVVEIQLREKERAAEMLKGYVTTITREVATITRQYINKLVSSGHVILAGHAGAAVEAADRINNDSVIDGNAGQSINTKETVR